MAMDSMPARYMSSYHTEFTPKPTRGRPAHRATSANRSSTMPSKPFCQFYCIPCMLTTSVHEDEPYISNSTDPTPGQRRSTSLVSPTRFAYRDQITSGAPPKLLSFQSKHHVHRSTPSVEVPYSHGWKPEPKFSSFRELRRSLRKRTHEAAQTIFCLPVRGSAKLVKMGRRKESGRGKLPANWTGDRSVISHPILRDSTVFPNEWFGDDGSEEKG